MFKTWKCFTHLYNFVPKRMHNINTQRAGVYGHILKKEKFALWTLVFFLNSPSAETSNLKPFLNKGTGSKWQWGCMVVHWPIVSLRKESSGNVIEIMLLLMGPADLKSPLKHKHDIICDGLSRPLVLNRSQIWWRSCI